RLARHRRVEGRRARPSVLVREPRREPRGRRPDQGGEVPRPCPRRRRRGARTALAADERDVAALRRVRREDRARDPGRRPRTRLASPSEPCPERTRPVPGTGRVYRGRVQFASHRGERAGSQEMSPPDMSGAWHQTWLVRTRPQRASGRGGSSRDALLAYERGGG